MANGNAREVRFRDLAEKAAPVADDQIALSDSADSGNPKRVKISNLPGGGSNGNGAGLPANPSLNDLIRYDGSDVVWGKIGADAILDDGIDTDRVLGDDIIGEDQIKPTLLAKIPAISSTGDVTKFLNERGVFAVPAGGSGGGGLDQAAVDARVTAGVKAFARTGSSTPPLPADLGPDSADGQTLIRSGAAVKWVDRRDAPADWAADGNTDTIPDAKLERKAAQGTFIRQAQPAEDTTTFQHDSSEETRTIYYGAITRGGNYGTTVVAGGEALRFNNLPVDSDTPAFLDGKFRFWARLNGTMRVKLEFVNTRTGSRTTIHDSTVRGSNAAQYAQFDISGENIKTVIRGHDDGLNANLYDLDFKISQLSAGTAYIQLRTAGYAADNGLRITHAVVNPAGVRPEALYGTDAKWDATDFDTATQARLVPLGGQTAAGVSVAASGFNGNLAPTDDTVQKALQKFDDFVVSAGSDDQTAAEVSVDASGFDGNLSSADDTVQKALASVDELVLGSAGVPDVSALPADPTEDQEVDLTAQVTITDFGVFRLAASAGPHIGAGWHAGTPEFGHVDRVSPLLLGVDYYTATAAANYRDRIIVERNPANTSAAATAISIRNLTDGGAAVSHALEAVPGEPNTYRTAVGIRLTTGKAWAIQVLFGATKAYPDRTLGPRRVGVDPPPRYQHHDYRWWLVPVPGAEPHSANFFTELLDDHTQGVTLNSAASAVRTPVQPFDHEVDLDDTPNGVIIFSTEWAVSGVTGTITLGQTTEQTVQVSLSAILRADPYHATLALGGVKATSIQLNGPAGAKAGDVDVYVVRDANNVVGYYLAYVPDGGTAGNHATITGRHTATLFRQDNRVASFLNLSDTPANYTGQGGKFVAVNSGADALVFADAPSGGGGGGATLLATQYTSRLGNTSGNAADLGVAVPAASDDLYAFVIGFSGSSFSGATEPPDSWGSVVFSGQAFAEIASDTSVGFRCNLVAGSGTQSARDYSFHVRRMANGNIGLYAGIAGNPDMITEFRLYRLGGGGSTSGGGTELPDDYDPAAGETIAQRDVFFTADGLQAGGALAAMTWGPWFDLWSNTEAAAAVLHHDFDLHGVIQWQTTLGGDRTWFEVQGVRTRASVDTVLWASAIYVRNLNGDPSTAESSTRVGTLECSRVVPYQAGDTYKLRVRVRCQRAYPDSALGARTAALNFMRFPASNAAADANHINTYRLKG